MTSKHESAAQVSVFDYYYSYVNAAGTEKANLAMARSASREAFKDRYRGGEVDLTEADLDVLHDGVFNSIDKQAGATAERLITQAVEWGMDTLPIPDDPILKTPVTLGNGGRKTLGAIMPEDIDDMYAERERNRQKVNQKADHWQVVAPRAKAILTLHGTFESAYMASAFYRGREAG